ncbi:hypothetical protein [Niveispirillum fermenti]|uniref:hypothetical protein n=1 Tax=Niveispirillum fermenti TaxID=1233113 RepID=UPI003A837A22
MNNKEIHADAMAIPVSPKGELNEDFRNLTTYISSIGKFYNELGLSPGRFEEWTSNFGADCCGISPDGEFLIPEFPVFSRLAWMDIDPVVLFHDDIINLIIECDNLIEKTNNIEVSLEAVNIKTLAQSAIINDFCIKFDYARQFYKMKPNNSKISTKLLWFICGIILCLVFFILFIIAVSNQFTTGLYISIWVIITIIFLFIMVGYFGWKLWQRK